MTALKDRLVKDGKFRAILTPTYDSKNRACIKIKPVRLVNKKPYCGNHPGECVVNPFTGPTKKPNATYLEWNDWVAFHKVVNTVLNKYKVNADVWSTPYDVRGKMHIRKGRVARKRYDYSEKINQYGMPVREWNQGDESQFT